MAAHLCASYQVDTLVLPGFLLPFLTVVFLPEHACSLSLSWSFRLIPWDFCKIWALTCVGVACPRCWNRLWKVSCPSEMTTRTFCSKSSFCCPHRHQKPTSTGNLECRYWWWKRRNYPPGGSACRPSAEISEYWIILALLSAYSIWKHCQRNCSASSRDHTRSTRGEPGWIHFQEMSSNTIFKKLHEFFCSYSARPRLNEKLWISARSCFSPSQEPWNS